jgi:DNA polymerase III epsilon subunit-like protein
VADALQVLFTCRKIKRKRRNKKQKKRIAEISAQGWTLEQLLLTDEQLRENDYPLMEAPFTLRSYAHAQSNEFVASTAGKGRTPVLAIDCEMVMTARGLELARVSALAWNGDPSSAETLVLDELVRPAAPVTDYLTQWSGITAEKLSDVSTTLGDVQQRLLDLIGESTILVGHSLENDLFALRLFHRRCIDTAVLFRNGRGFKCSLRSLAEKYLGESIQQSSGGHDSIQDARAALRLVRFAMWQPHQPGVVSFRMQDLNENQGVPLLELLSDLGRRVTLVSRASDPLLVPGSLSPTMRLCAVPSHADVWDAARRHLSEPAADPNPPLAPELTLIHWTELMEVQRAALSSGASSQSVVEARLEALRRAAAGLDQLLTCAPSGRALFLVSSLHGDTAFLSSKQRTNASNCSTLSPAEVEQARQQFQAAVAAARDAFTLLAVP